MVTYPDLSNLTASSTIGDFLALPNQSYPYFWAWILGGIWLIITFTLFFIEKERKGFGNMLSCMAVASFAIIVLSVTGSIVGIVTQSIMIYILIFGMVIIGVWFFVSSR